MLAAAKPVVLDGGLATQCEAMGFDISGPLWSAELLETNPRAIVDAHRAYLDAGARVIITASYQASWLGFQEAGKSAERADELIVSSVTLAERARDEFLDDNPAAERPLIAASIGPYGAAMHDGSEYTGDYGVTSGVLRDFHEHRIRLLDASSADVLACETVPSFVEAVVLAEGSKRSRDAGIAMLARNRGGDESWPERYLFAPAVRVIAPFLLDRRVESIWLRAGSIIAGIGGATLREK